MNLKFIRGAPVLVLVICILAVLPLQAIAADPLPVDLMVTGSIEYDSDGSAYGDHAYDGSLQMDSGGWGILSTFPGSPILSGDLTHTGDSFGTSASASIGQLDQYFFGIDLGIDLSNTSSTDTYKVSFLVDYNNHVEATGPDAFSHSEFFIEDSSGEVFFTDILSDTLFGNELGGVPTGGFGGPVDQGGQFFFDIILEPLMDELLLGFFTFEGGTFDDSTSAMLDFNALVSIDGVEVVPVPEPGTFFLLGTALVGLFCFRRLKTS